MTIKKLSIKAGENNGWKRIVVLFTPKKKSKCRLPRIRGTDRYGVRWEAYVEPLGSFGPYTILQFPVGKKRRTSK